MVAVVAVAAVAVVAAVAAVAAVAVAVVTVALAAVYNACCPCASASTVQVVRAPAESGRWKCAGCSSLTARVKVKVKVEKCKESDKIQKNKAKALTTVHVSTLDTVCPAARLTTMQYTNVLQTSPHAALCALWQLQVTPLQST